MRSSPPETRNTTKRALWEHSEWLPEVISTAVPESITTLIEFDAPH